MPDIFISYKKEERDVAARLATRLVEAGYDVWWDAALLAGDRFEDEISSVLANSRTVIILWSRRSVASDWVKAEAESARQQKKALPVIIDDLPIDSLPLLYRGVHVAQLRDWQGDDAHAGFGELMKSVTDRLGAARGPELTAPQAQARLAASADEAEIWAAIAAGNDPSADEYRAYLKRFGPNARFADLANIRIARLERETPPGPPAPRKRRRFWWPAVVLPVLALLVIGAGWFWLANGLTLKTFTNMLVPQETRDAAARCRTWGAGGDLDWHAMVPVSSPFSLSDCQKAQAGFPDEGDYDGLLAMARIADDPSAAADASALAQKGADLGSAIANDVLGVMYQAGNNFKPDLSKAASYFKVAADKGYLRADARLCYLAADAEPVPFTASYDEIVRYCTLATTSGDALGEATLGYLYENGGYGLQVDLTRAEYLYKEAADQNFVLAQVLLGALQYRGSKVQQDPPSAFALFQKAAARGYPAGLRWLAIAYELGIGTPVDIPHAGQLYDQAGAANDVVAAFLLGYKVADGTPATAIVDNELNRFGDAPTDPVGLRILGQLFERGFNRTMDAAQAVATYQRCAGTNALCQFILGSYFKYRAPTADLVAAARLYQQGAAAGEMHSQFELGYMYETGEGEPKDLQKAAALYTAAAQQGNGVARDRLAHLNSGSASP